MARSRREIQTPPQEKETVVSKQQGTGIRCPDCGGTSRVKSTEPIPEKSTMMRYRKCDSCGTHFYTEEKFCRRTEPRGK